MATYFHGGPEMQADGLQTFYLMNPRYAGYASADAAAPATPANMLFLNQASASSMDQASPTHGHHQQHQQQNHHFVGIPLQAPTVAAAPELSRQMSSIHMPNDMSQGLISRAAQYNLWNQAQASNNGPVSLVSQLGNQRPTTLDTQQSQKGLSLSLSPQHSNYNNVYRPEQGQQEGMTAMMNQDPAATAGCQHDMRFGPPSTSSASNGGVGLQSFVMGSKYLKAAQQLLDEVVSVGTPRGVKEDTSKAIKAAEKADADGKTESGSTGEAASGKNVVLDLSTAERQELQMKKAKLINMLDEVEQRYRQYHQQMLIVISSFESVAGHASARTYTSLALRTISKQFRCLRDAITGQIQAAGKSLGEEDYMGGSKSPAGSRLRLVDHHLRQQRALQQLGMMQHNAWRPQRGLPERSVSVLRAWLFEHFLHPYPKDSDKLMLAKQTGLTRNQVSNWFINARVRLWKPMVEEMYQEETKGLEQQLQQQNNPEDSGNTKLRDKGEQVSTPNSTSSPSRTEQSDSIISRTFNQQHSHDQQNQHFTMPPQSPTGNLRTPLAQYDEAEAQGLIQTGMKKARTDGAQEMNPVAFSMMHQDLKPEEPNNQEMFMKFGDIMQAGDDQGFNLIASHAAGFGGYAFGDIGRFDATQFAPRFSGNGVSLTLGLQHCDQSMQQPGAVQPSYLSNGSIGLGRRLEVGTDSNNGYCNLNDNNNNNHTPVVTTNAYDNHSIENRKRFAAQLLPDYVS